MESVNNVNRNLNKKMKRKRDFYSRATVICAELTNRKLELTLTPAPTDWINHTYPASSKSIVFHKLSLEEFVKYKRPI